MAHRSTRVHSAPSSVEHDTNGIRGDADVGVQRKHSWSRWGFAHAVIFSAFVLSLVPTVDAQVDELPGEEGLRTDSVSHDPLTGYPDGALYVRLEGSSGIGRSRGAAHLGALHLGVRFPVTTSGNWEAEGGVTLWGGAWNEVATRSYQPLFGMGMFVDVRYVLNPQGIAQFLLLGGIDARMGGPLQHAPLPDSDECPGTIMPGASLGLGGQVSLGDFQLGLTVRIRRSRALGEDIRFVGNRRNPPDDPVAFLNTLAAQLTFAYAPR